MRKKLGYSNACEIHEGWSLEICRVRTDESAVRGKVMASYRSRQTEDRLLSYQPFGEVHIVLKIWEVIHVDPNLENVNTMVGLTSEL